MKKIINLLFVLLLLTSCTAQKTELSLNLEKGKEYKLSSTSESTITQEMNGQKITMLMTIDGTMAFLVKAVHDKDYEMEVKYENLSMIMQLPQGTMEFNSEKNDENDVFSKMLSAMKKSSFQIKMTKKGKVTEVKNLDELFNSIFSDFPEIPENQKAQLKAQLMKAYGEEAFKGNLEMITAIYPDKPVSQGDTWVVHTKLESGMAGEMTTTYKLAEISSDYYLILGDSKIQTADKDAYIETNGMPMKYDMNGSMKSEIKIDKNSGWIIDAKVEQELSGDVYIKESPQLPNGMKIPMNMKNEMIYSGK